RRAGVGRRRTYRRRRGLQEKRRAEIRRKVAAALCERRNVRGQDASDELARALKVAEEEGVIFDDWPADGKAVLIAAEDRFLRVVGRCGRKQVARVQYFITQKLEGRAVQTVRTGFGC